MRDAPRSGEIKKAQPRHFEMLEQSFLRVLPLELRQLLRGHLTPVRARASGPFRGESRAWRLRPHPPLSAAVNFSSRTVSRRSRSSRSSAPGESISGETSSRRVAVSSRRAPSAARVAAVLIRCGAQARRVAFEILFQLVARKGLGGRSRRFDFGAGARGGLLRLGGGVEHRVDAVSEAFQLASAGRATRTRPALKRAVDSFQHRVERDACLLPRFNDRPVERRDQQMRAALLPEILLDLGEIIEVVERFHGDRWLGVSRARSEKLCER